MTDFHLLDLPSDRMEGDVVVAFFFEDDRPLVGAAAVLDWRLNGHLTRMLLDEEVSGRVSDAVLVQNNGKLHADWALFVGGGRRSRVSLDGWQKKLKKCIMQCRKAGFDRVAICLEASDSVPTAELEAAAREALLEQGDAATEFLFSFDILSAGNDLLAADGN